MNRQETDESLPSGVVEKLALRALARREATATTAHPSAAYVTGAAWQPRGDFSDSDDDDEDEGEGEGDAYGFVIPPGWITMREDDSNASTWTNGTHIVSTITEAWELYRQQSDAANQRE